MRKILFILIITVACTCNGHAQSLVTKVDSIEINGHSNYYIKLLNDTLYSIEWDDGKVTRYTLQGAFIDSFRLGGRFNKGVSYHRRLNGFAKTENGYTVYTANAQRFYFLDGKGEIKKSKRLKGKYKGVTYDIAPYHLFDAVRYVDENSGYLLPIEMVTKKEGDQAAFGPVGNPHYRTFYKNGGLVGLFNKKGKLKKVYGNWDRVFLENEFLTYYPKTYFQYDDDKLYIGTAATTNIQVWSLEGELIDTIKPLYNPLNQMETFPTIKSRFESDRYHFHHMIETPSAWSFYISNSNKVLIRNYRPKSVDTCVLGPDYLQRFEEYDSLKMIKGLCPRPLSELSSQQAQIMAKPYEVYGYVLDDTLENPVRYPIQPENQKAFIPIGITSTGFLLRLDSYDNKGKRYVIGIYKLR